MNRLISIGILLLSFTLIFSPIYCLVPSHAYLSVKSDSVSPWWNGDWHYRKYHVIESATSAGAGYQVQMTVINSSGVDDAGTVYVDNKTRPDFGDVRFVANDESTILSYWAESVFNGENATYWVKISDDLSVGNATVWMYYGNPEATSQSNGTSTFLAFDDFEGPTIDNSIWEVSGQVMTSNVFSFTGTQCMEHGSAVSYLSLRNIPVPSNFKICAWLRDTLSATIETVLNVQTQDQASMCVVGVDSDVSTTQYVSRNAFTYSVSNISRTAAFHKMEVEYTDKLYLYIDGALQPLQGVAQAPEKIWLGSPWADNSGNSFWDTFYIRKCVSQEPVQGSWSSEEPHFLLGDLNGDGKVDLIDLVILANAYGSAPGSPNWNSNADINQDGHVNLTDLVILATQYGQHW